MKIAIEKVKELLESGMTYRLVADASGWTQSQIVMAAKIWGIVRSPGRKKVRETQQ